MSRLGFPSDSIGDRARPLRPFAWATGVAGVILALSLPSHAQELTGADLWNQGACFNCHGNLAEGDGDPAYPAGPNLRRTLLDRDQLIMIIACGRPFTAMPFNLEGAYTEVPCHGLPLGEVPGVPAGANFTAEQVETLVEFLVEHVVGVTRITRENCATFYGGNINAPGCREY
jgi:hypothetical protein